MGAAFKETGEDQEMITLLSAGIRVVQFFMFFCLFHSQDEASYDENFFCDAFI